MQTEFVQLLNPLAQDTKEISDGESWEEKFGKLVIPHGQDAQNAPLACSMTSVALADYFLRLLPNAVVSLSALTNSITFGSQIWRALTGNNPTSFSLSHALYYMQNLNVREIDGASFVNLPGGDFGGEGEYKIDIKEQLTWSKHFAMPVCALVLASYPTDGINDMTLQEQMESRSIGNTYCVASFLGCQNRHRGGHQSLTPFYITDTHGKTGMLHRARTVDECANILQNTLGVNPETMDITWTWVRNPFIPCTVEKYDKCVAIARKQYEQIPDYPIKVGVGGSLLVPDTRTNDILELKAHKERIKRGLNAQKSSKKSNPASFEKPYEDHEYSEESYASSSGSIRGSQYFVQKGSMYHQDSDKAPYIDTYVVKSNKK